MFKKTKNTAGFTFVEIVVVMGIVSLLTLGMVTMNDSTTKRKKIEMFQNDVDTVLTYLRSARSDAITNRVIGSSTPDGGFGVHLEYLDGSNPKMRITHFVDDNDGSGGGVEDGQYSADDTELEQKTIPAPWKFSIENTKPDTVTPTTTFTTIFIPPNAVMVMNDGTASNDIRSSELTFEYMGRTKRICMNRVSRFFEVISGDECS